MSKNLQQQKVKIFKSKITAPARNQVPQRTTKKSSSTARLRNAIKEAAVFAHEPQSVTTYKQADDILLEYAKLAARQLKQQQANIQKKPKSKIRPISYNIEDLFKPHNDE